MEIVCLDLEGVLVPEIWISVAEKTGIYELSATTRDIPDYDELMRQRLRIMKDHNLNLTVIQNVIGELKPLDGAKTFLDWLKTEFQVVILSDTFYEFASPLMRQLDWPTLFCHRLKIDSKGHIIGYNLRMKDHKCEAVKAFKSLHFRVLAAGDSYNDISMLLEADLGIFFRAPVNISKKFPKVPVTNKYGELKRYLIGGK